MDSINHGLEHLEHGVKADNKKDYKQAVLSLFQGTELLLKELLCQINPILMFDKNSLFKKCSNPMNPKIDELFNCKSIEVNELRVELIKHYPQDFSTTSLKVVEKLAQVRNKVQHFCLSVDKDEVRSLLLQLHQHVLAPALRIISKSILKSKHNDYLNERLEEIFSFMDVAEKEAGFLRLSDREFTRGSCFACGIFSFFIFYDGDSYPQEFYCTSCDLKVQNIKIEEYRQCPECGAYSLVFIPELDGGVCLWYKCANHKDGGIITKMEYCEHCQDYKVESECKCNVK